MKEIDRERGNYGLESYLEDVRQEGGKVEQAEANGLTVVKALKPFTDVYIALRGGRVMAGKHINYDGGRNPKQIECFELSDVLTTHSIEPFRVSSQINNLDVDHFYTHSGDFTSLFFPISSDRMLVDIMYARRKNSPDFVPVHFMIRHDARNLLTVDPEEKSAGFRNFAFKETGLPFPKLPLEIDGVNYSMSFVEDDNAFTIVQDRGDAGKVLAGGFLAISQDKYDSLKGALMSDEVWGRDLSMLTPLHYSVQSPKPKQGSSA